MLLTVTFNLHQKLILIKSLMAYRSHVVVAEKCWERNISRAEWILDTLVRDVEIVVCQAAFEVTNLDMVFVGDLGAITIIGTCGTPSTAVVITFTTQCTPSLLAIFTVTITFLQFRLTGSIEAADGACGRASWPGIGNKFLEGRPTSSK